MTNKLYIIVRLQLYNWLLIRDY